MPRPPPLRKLPPQPPRSRRRKPTGVIANLYIFGFLVPAGNFITAFSDFVLWKKKTYIRAPRARISFPFGAENFASIGRAHSVPRGRGFSSPFCPRNHRVPHRPWIAPCFTPLFLARPWSFPGSLRAIYSVGLPRWCSLAFSASLARRHRASNIPPPLGPPRRNVSAHTSLDFGGRPGSGARSALFFFFPLGRSYPGFWDF